MRQLGGTLSLAVASSIMYDSALQTHASLSLFLPYHFTDHFFYRNNTLTNSMRTLGLPSSTIKIIVSDPSKLEYPSSIGMAPSTAISILDNGYTKGFRILFILHASLTVVATLTSITMIKQKSLTRAGE